MNVSSNVLVSYPFEFKDLYKDLPMHNEEVQDVGKVIVYWKIPWC